MKILLISFLLFSETIFANSSLYYGEEFPDDYYGPFDPDFIKVKDKVILKDRLYYDRLIPFSISEDLFNLAEFYNEDVKKNLQCPEAYFSKNVPYIRYLFRLLTLSYLQESISKYHFSLYSLGGKLSGCPKDFKEVLRKCNPRSFDMKLFLKRANVYLKRSKNRQKYFKMNNISKKRWVETFSFRKEISLPVSRIASWCKHNDKLCDKIDIKTAIKGLSLSCSEDISLAKLICSEKDDIFGLSSINLALELLEKSHSKNVINQGGYGESCLSRFRSTFKKKEQRYYQLSRLFEMVHRNLTIKKSAYLQGELFLPGSLKEFDDLGLNDFLFVKKKVVKKVPKVTKKVIKKPKEIAKVIPKIKKVKIKKIVKKKKVIPPKKVIKISYFERQLLKYKKSNKVELKLDSDLYKKDYVFSSAYVKKMKEPLKVYQTRAAIKDMLDYDKIGSFKTPFQISFIKYLIDYNYHQGLFNIISIIGTEFYIKNDLDKKTEPIYIRLINDETSDNKWQVSFIKAPKPLITPDIKKIAPIKKKKKIKKKRKKRKVRPSRFAPSF